MKKNEIFLSSNIKYLRMSNKKTQKDIGDLCGKTDTAVSNWEKGIREPDTIDLANIANYFNVSIDELMLKDLRFDNAVSIDIKPTNMVKIPVLSKIPAGMSFDVIEEQFTLGFEEIPKEWLNGNKEYFALKLVGDSMEPDYHDDDIGIFLKTNDCENGQDCCVRINGFDATFKRIKKQENGIMIIPLNENSSTPFNSAFYTNDDIINMPIEIIGVIKQIRRNK